MEMLYHPNIVKLYRVFETKDDMYLVIEHAFGGNVLDFLNDLPEYRMPEGDARAKFRQTLYAVEYFHRHNIAHR